MARTTLEMFIKLIGADKVGRALDSTSKKIKNTQDQVDKGTKENAKYAAGMSGLSKAAVAGAVTGFARGTAAVRHALPGGRGAIAFCRV